MKSGRIVFLPVPKTFTEYPRNNHSFTINPEIPVPVEISENNPETLNAEMILSGMLNVIKTEYSNRNILDDIHVCKPEWIDYYRCFILAFRPEIPAELSEAAAGKAHNGDFEAAMEILSLLEALLPMSSYVSLNRALVLEIKAAYYQKTGNKNAQDALNEAQDAYNEIPESPPALYNAGCFFRNLKNYQKAADFFSRYIEIADDNEKKEYAEEILNEIQDKGLDDESFNEAYQLIQNGKAEEALSAIRDFLERRPFVWNGWFVLGWSLRLLGRYQDAKAAFAKAIDLGGGGSDTRNELAICLLESGDNSGAQKELEAALRDDTENIKIISNLGILAMKSGDTEKAAAFFRTVLEFAPGDPIAKQYLEHL
jgi:tetratricopeptide (TPR) repeat protein